MRLGKASVLGLVTGAVMVGLAAPAAADTGEVLVRPGEVRPGGQVTVVGKKCRDDGTAGSLAFAGGAVELNGAEEVDGRAGLATIKEDAFPGTYTVLVRCGAHRAVGEVEVVAGGSRPKTEPRPTPSGGAAAGLGGGSGGSGAVLPAVGGVLLLGAFGAGAAAVRRRGGSAA